MPEQFIELDDRRRVSLGKVGHSEHRRYLARTQPDGTIVLTPAVILSEAESRLRRNPKVLDAIRESREHPERLVRRHRPVPG